ncbi:MAG TPA: NAD(P)-binding domain-containing protein [Solirubrobacterales bacterium]
MEIGIIGAGNIGGTLTRQLTKLGHDVRVSNSRAPETLAELAAETGATAVWAKDAPVDADLVIVSIPQKNVPDLAPGIVATAKAGAPVIETNNYYPRERDGLIEPIEDGTPESVWVSELLGAPVFKIFNGIFWKHLLENGQPKGAVGRIALPIAGDDPAGKEIVSDLVDQLGFDPVDAGPLSESWRQQPGTPVYGTDLDAEAAKRALAEASPERTDAFRAER